MKHRHVCMILLFSFLVVAGGCSTHRINLKNIGHVAMENRSPGNVKILWSHVYDEDGLLIVNGMLRRKDHSAVSIPIHVHVLVLSTDNQVTQSLQTGTLYVPPNRTGRGGDWTRFEVRSSAVPQPGSRLEVIVHTHDESHSDRELLSPFATDSSMPTESLSK